MMEVNKFICVLTVMWYWSYARW